jgi:mRNA-degrading endonuclease YafQ of YafQ-DinJ toxin-antitoxin module
MSSYDYLVLTVSIQYIGISFKTTKRVVSYNLNIQCYIRLAFKLRLCVEHPQLHYFTQIMDSCYHFHHQQRTINLHNACLNVLQNSEENEDNYLDHTLSGQHNDAHDSTLDVLKLIY